jgi:wyosine [tRNA(Phe)-imidazoG37] synthetase (radical SAM superfamily)
MLLEGVNDGLKDLMATAAMVAELRPSVAYLTVPTRPPAETWARPPKESTLIRAFEVFRAFHHPVELLLGYEGDAFASTGDPVADLLSITAVHPMREAAVRRLLSGRKRPWSLVQDLVDREELVEVRYGLHHYYLRPVRPRCSPGAYFRRSGPQTSFNDP